MFIIILINISITKLILNIDFPKYLPKNKLGFILEKLINRYIKIWHVNSKLLIIFSCVMICFLY
jgi:hypothetical protein